MRPLPGLDVPIVGPGGQVQQVWYEYLQSIAGDIARPGYGYFVVDRNGSDQTGATANTYNKIQFTNEVVDSQNFFDNATNFRFQPTQAGWYLITVGASAIAGASGTAQAAIYKNGSRIAEGSYANVTSASSWSNTQYLVQLNGSTDYIEGFCFLSAGITTINGATTNTFMFGYRIA